MDAGAVHCVGPEVASPSAAGSSNQIVSRVEVLASGQGADLDVKRLSGSDLFRLRIGDYRVLFTIDRAAQVLTVELIRTRGDV